MMTDDTREPLSVTPKEAQRLIGVSNTTLYGLLGQGMIDSFLVGRKRLIKYSSLKKFANGGVAA